MARYPDEEDAFAGGPCYLCASPDPHVRSCHHLRLAKECSLAEVRAHLVGNTVRQERADECVRWLAQVIEQYTGIPDPHTGAPLPWWDARQQLVLARDQIAAHCYGEAPEAYRLRFEATPPNEVPGFAHVMADAGTPFPDEDPYVPTPEEARFYSDPEAWEGHEPGWNDGP